MMLFNHRKQFMEYMFSIILFDDNIKYHLDYYVKKFSIKIKLSLC